MMKRYELSSMVISQGNEQSNEIPIREVVLQGEILSPLLFALFISDFDDFFLLLKAPEE